MGVMWDLQLRGTRLDRREQSVRAFLQRFQVDEARAGRTADIAATLYARLRPGSDATTRPLYWSGLLLAWPALGLVVGTELARLLRRGEPMPVLGAMVVGLIVLHLVTHLPIVGGLVAFLGLAFGLGLIVQSFRRFRHPSVPSRAAIPVAVPA